MDKLILFPTEILQWKALVNDAEKKIAFQLEELLESYLVFLLHRFVQEQQLSSNVMATEFLTCTENKTHLDKKKLQQVGDKCLLFSGLFPGHAQKKHVRVSYFVKLGQSAYALLASDSHDVHTKLYEALYHQFHDLMTVLQAIRSLSVQPEALSLIQAYELWNDTGNEHALALLKRYTSGIAVRESSTKYRH